MTSGEPASGAHQGTADSAGVPWAGRTLAPSPFDGDDGRTDPALAAALSAYAAGEADLAVVAAALGDVRVLVPVVAVLGEAEQVQPVSGAGPALTADKSADMALVTLRAPDGRAALPVFTSVAALAAWDATARPVPVGARRAALSAVDEGCSLLVLDPSGPVTAVLPRPAVWAVAQGEPWTPALRDPQVLAAVVMAAGAVPGVESVRCVPGQRAEVRVVLTVRPGLDRAGLDEVTSAVSRSLAATQLVADRVDSLELRVEAAGAG